MKKKILSMLLVGGLVSGLLIGCGSETAKDDTDSSKELEVIKVGCSPVPHAEVLENLVDDMAEAGYDMQIVESNDLLQPDASLVEGELDCNYYQHITGMEWYNAEHDSNIVAVGGNEKGRIHYEPLGIYPGKTDSIENLQEGAVVTVPNETSNEARALLLLEEQGLIKLKSDAGLGATIQDIEENPLNLEIQEIDGAQLVRSLEDADIAIITGNYALEAGLSVTKDALAVESSESDAAYNYANILAVNDGDQDGEAVQTLLGLLQSDKTKAFMEENYMGAVMPLF